MNKFFKELEDFLISGIPVIQIVSHEESRVISKVTSFFSRRMPSIPIKTWDLINPFKNEGETLKDALQFIINLKENGVFIIKDINKELNDNPQTLRVLRNINSAFRKRTEFKKYVILIAPESNLPYACQREVGQLIFPLPSFEELAGLLENFIIQWQKMGNTISISLDEQSLFVRALQGLSYDEAFAALKKVFYKNKNVGIDDLAILLKEKQQLISKNGVLEFVNHRFSLADLGGYDNLKSWLKKRKNAFGSEAESFGLKKPKGLLTMGISGCGKSLSAKVIAALWSLPLYRLDMNLVYSGMSGSPEEVFSRALKTVDSVAPAVLWIDEIESGISDKQGDGASSRILGYFLTWMQEHESDIFVAATANRIDLLPAELLRRGRFDEIFFIDLPTQKEREEIFKIHLEKNKNNLDDFSLIQLGKITKGWTGSEIEQVIISGMYEAFNEGVKLNEDHLFSIFGNTVPLSKTMEEQIKKIRSWAHNRAARASSDKEY